METKHNEAYRRHKDYIHQKRKEKILTEVYKSPDNKLLEKPHKLNKGKVHCSCGICTCKTKAQGYKHSDLVNMCKGECCDSL